MGFFCGSINIYMKNVLVLLFSLNLSSSVWPDLRDLRVLCMLLFSFSNCSIFLCMSFIVCVSFLFFFFSVCLQVLLCGLYCHVLVECDFSLFPHQTVEFHGTDHQYPDTLCISNLFATVSLIWLLLVDLDYFLSHGNNRGGGNGWGGGRGVYMIWSLW